METKVLNNHSLKSYNTFGFDVKARHFASFSSKEELIALLKEVNSDPHMILGGGSNVLFTKDYPGWILKNEIKGIDIIDEDHRQVTVKVGAGEIWHEFVLYCIDHGWGGIENMSLIPGVVGAAPIQNIGAYGVEQKDVFVSLEALHKKSFTTKTFSNAECKFGYRDSIFKGEAKDEYVILQVTYQLSGESTVNTNYGAISDVLEAKGLHHPTIQNVSDAVISIRQSKLPDPAVIGNAGSFFKNPVISGEHFKRLLEIEPEARFFRMDTGEYKIPAGWLIEYCGFKGMVVDGKDIGVHKNQALVLVNYGNGNGKDVLELSEKIIDTVYTRFGIQLEREVNII